MSYGIARRFATAAIAAVLAASGASAASTAPTPETRPAAPAGAPVRWEVRDGEVRRDHGAVAEAYDAWRRSRPGSQEAAAAARALTRASLRQAGFVGPLDDEPVAYTELAAVGDLDGDGRADTVESALTRNAAGPWTLLRGRRGYDGRVLWEQRIPGYAYVAPARVGSAGGHGVLVLSFVQQATSAPVGLAVAEAWTVAAYDGRGAQVWSRPMPPDVWGFAPAVFVIAGAPMVFGVADLLPGKADDIVLGLAAITAGPAGWVSGYPAWVVNGADGTIGPVPAPTVDVPDAGTLVIPVPDLTGDGFADLLFLAGRGAQVTIAAQSATGGQPAWTARDLPVRWPVWPDLLGDVTGDRRGDIAVAVDSGADEDPQLLVLSGADGTPAGRYPGHVALSAGDVNRDGRRDVTTLAFTAESPRLEVSVTAYGAPGRVAYRHVERFGPFGEEDWANASVYDAGDVQGDGARELGVSLGIHRERKSLKRDALLNGRTGRVLHRTLGRPLAAPLDRRGDDLLTLTSTPSGTARVTAIQGSTGATLWSTAIRAAASLTIFDTQLSWADVDGDRCADVVLSATDDEGTLAVVLRGRDGRPAWGLRVSTAGAGPLSGVTPGADRNRGC